MNKRVRITDVCMPTWRVGDRVDALDYEGMWYDSVVLDLVFHKNSWLTLVHYMGWDAKWDCWVRPTNIAPLWSKVHNWRGALRAGDCVEVKLNTTKAAWFPATVLFRCDETQTVWLTLQDSGSGPFIYSINSDSIARAGLHCGANRRERYMRLLWLKTVAVYAAEQVEVAWQEPCVVGRLLLPVVLADTLRISIQNAELTVVSELALVVALFL